LSNDSDFQGSVYSLIPANETGENCPKAGAPAMSGEFPLRFFQGSSDVAVINAWWDRPPLAQ